MGAFTNLLIKEVKSIVRDPKMLVAMFIVPLIVIGVMYGVMSATMREQIRQVRRESRFLAVVDLDKGPWSQRFIEYLRANATSVKVLEEPPHNIPDAMEELGVKILYVIPGNFSELLDANKTATIEYYVLLKSLTFGELSLASVASGLVNGFSENITRTIIAREGVPREFIEHPVNSSSKAIIGGRIVTRPEQIFVNVFAIGFMVPIIAFLMLTFIIQFAVTSMAVEKEEKMFETLLTLPINRLSIVGVKILVSIVIGIAYVVIYGAILLWFFTGSVSTPSEPGISLSLTDILPANTMYCMGIGLIGAVIFGLLIAIVLSLFAEDVRTAQLIANYTLMPLALIFFIPMFFDISELSYGAKLALSLVPLANIGLIPKLSILGYSGLAAIAGSSNIVYALVSLFIAYRIVNTEKIFTAKLFRRLRGRR